jgi:hypothetical protein
MYIRNSFLSYELQNSLAEEGNLAVTVTRDCVGIWDLLTGKLISKLAASPLGAIVTHACITQNSK